MRFRVPLFALLFVAGSLALPLVAHAGIPFFGPIIPDEVNQCAAGWGLILVVVNNIISFLITIAIVFVAPLMIAYAGFLFVLNPVNASGKEKAKSILWNTIIGIVIALAGWMIVDAVMVALYNPDTPINGGRLGVWSQLIGSRGALPCIPLAESLRQAVPGAGITGVSTDGAVSYINGGATALCSSSNTACSPAILQAAGFSPAQANAMSCIAVTESSGNPNIRDSATGACGLFQITNRPGNWSNPAFHRSPCSTTSLCNDPVCNTQTAQIMFSQQGYQPWTGICRNPAGCGVVAYGQPWNAGARACVSQYDPSRLTN